MTTINAGISQLSPSEHQIQLRRAVIPATIGTAIEWYDFFLYSTVTGLVFAKLYFPNSDPLVGTLEAFGIYAVGFIARPIGAVRGLRGVLFKTGTKRQDGGRSRAFSPDGRRVSVSNAAGPPGGAFF